MEAGVWEPDLVVVSAGFDALDSDPLASVSLQASDFGRMADRLHEHLVRESLSPLCRKKRRPAIVLGLEGGYQIDETSGGGNLPVAVVAMIQALLEARRRGNCPTQPTSLKSFTGLYN
jgi:acetoin utilization deacetylase AcuC-like enzyme